MIKIYIARLLNNQFNEINTFLITFMLGNSVKILKENFFSSLYFIFIFVWKKKFSRIRIFFEKRIPFGGVDASEKSCVEENSEKLGKRFSFSFLCLIGKFSSLYSIGFWRFSGFRWFNFPLFFFFEPTILYLVRSHCELHSFIEKNYLVNLLIGFFV